MSTPQGIKLRSGRVTRPLNAPTSTHGNNFDDEFDPFSPSGSRQAIVSAHDAFTTPRTTFNNATNRRIQLSSVSSATQTSLVTSTVNTTTSTSRNSIETVTIQSLSAPASSHSASISHHQPSPSRNRFTSNIDSAVTPKPFLGTEAEDFDTWLRRFEEYSNLLGHNSDEKRALLPLYLRGRAEIFYYDLENSEKGSYNSLIQRLISKFGREANYVLEQELYNRVQQPGESVDTYATSIHTLCSKLKFPASQRLSPFLRGLLRPIQTYVMSNRPNNVEEAERLAKLWEQLQQIQQPTVAAMSTPSTNDATVLLLSELTNINERLEKIEASNRKQNSRRYNNRTQQWKGRQKSPRPPTESQDTQHDNKRTPRCYNCHKVGHFKRDCRAGPRGQFNSHSEN